MEGDEAGALELEDADAMLAGLCTQAEGVCEIAHGELVTEFASGIRARRQRVALLAHPQPPLTQRVPVTRGPGKQFQRHLR